MESSVLYRSHEKGKIDRLWAFEWLKKAGGQADSIWRAQYYIGVKRRGREGEVP